MTSFPGPVKCTDLVPYTPQRHPSLQATRIQDILMGESFKAQVADYHYLNQRIQVSIPLPQFSASRPKPFNGTCAECLNTVKDTVHHTIDTMDYDGLKPFVKIIDQMEKQEKPIDAWTVDAQNEEPGSTCIGMSLALIKNIREKHGVGGALAIEQNNKGTFGHATVIVECKDGLLFIDNRAAPTARLFPIPFNSPFQGNGFSITASPKGTMPPLTIDKTNDPDATLKYYTHIANGADIASKEYMAHAITEIIPIATYKKDGNKIKDIIIKPTELRIRLMNYGSNKKDYITFEEIRQGGAWRTQLKEFMGSDFHLPPQIVHDELVKFAFHEYALRKIFSQVHA